MPTILNSIILIIDCRSVHVDRRKDLLIAFWNVAENYSLKAKEIGDIITIDNIFGAFTYMKNCILEILCSNFCIYTNFKY